MPVCGDSPLLAFGKTTFAFRPTVLKVFRGYLKTDDNLGASLPLTELAKRLFTAAVKMGPGIPALKHDRQQLGVARACGR